MVAELGIVKPCAWFRSYVLEDLVDQDLADLQDREDLENPGDLQELEDLHDLEDLQNLKDLQDLEISLRS